jgi:hypothetical protein
MIDKRHIEKHLEPLFDKEQYHCLKEFWKAIESKSYDRLFGLLAEDCIFEFQWLEPKKLEWKEAIINFFKTKNQPEYAFYQTIMINWKDLETVTVGWELVENNITFEKWEMALLIDQYFDMKKWDNIIVVFIRVNKEWKIKKVYYSIPQLYKYTYVNLWNNFIHAPKYEEDNILDQQELCSYLVNVWIEALKEWWYSNIRVIPWLDKYANFLWEKDWKLSFYLHRCVNKNEDKWIENERTIIDKHLRKFWYRFAKDYGAEFYILLCYLSSRNQINKDKWIIRRWDDILPEPIWLEPGDFDLEIDLEKIENFIQSFENIWPDGLRVMNEEKWYFWLNRRILLDNMRFYSHWIEETEEKCSCWSKLYQCKYAFEWTSWFWILQFWDDIIYRRINSWIVAVCPNCKRQVYLVPDSGNRRAWEKIEIKKSILLELALWK